MSLLHLGNEVFSNFVFYGTLVLGKTTLMSLMTSFYRIKTNSLPSVEDAKWMDPNNKEKQKQMLVRNEDVERVRKAHRNDLENIIPFVLMGLLYVSINPNPVTALWHFRIFFASRILHTIAYVGGIRQPTRGFGFLGGFIVFWSILVQTLMKLCG